MSGYQSTPPDAGASNMAPGGTPTNMAPGGAPTHTAPAHAAPGHAAPARRWGGETKAAFRTTELIAYLAAVLGVLIASAVVDEAGNAGGGFEADQAWLYVTLLTIGYLISRGLAKSGSRHHDDGFGR
jgi:hypothetical protein